MSHEGILEDQGKDPLALLHGPRGRRRTRCSSDAIAIAATLSRDPAADGPHVVTGPIFVEGAVPGDLLRITVGDARAARAVRRDLEPARQGRARRASCPAATHHVSVFTPVEERDGRLVGLLPVVDDGERVIAFPLAPFLGTMGVAVAGDERPHSVPPGAHGGNIDINLLVEGTRALPAGAGRRARSPTSAIRTSRRATARWRSPRSRRRCGRPCGSTSSRAPRRSPSSARSPGRSCAPPSTSCRPGSTRT